MGIAERIRKQRIAKRLTQKRLGEACGIAESTIRQYELGLRNPKLTTIRKIAVALEIPTAMLIEEDSIDMAKQRLIAYYEMLNETGKKELEQKAKEFTKIKEYIVDLI